MLAPFRVSTQMYNMPRTKTCGTRHQPRTTPPFPPLHGLVEMLACGMWLETRSNTSDSVNRSFLEIRSEPVIQARRLTFELEEGECCVTLRSAAAA
jgi:hypothetical protein